MLGRPSSKSHNFAAQIPAPWQYTYTLLTYPRFFSKCREERRGGPDPPVVIFIKVVRNPLYPRDTHYYHARSSRPVAACSTSILHPTLWCASTARRARAPNANTRRVVHLLALLAYTPNQVLLHSTKCPAHILFCPARLQWHVACSGLSLSFQKQPLERPADLQGPAGAREAGAGRGRQREK